MKKLWITATAVACFALSAARAQTVNGIRLTELKAGYIELSAVSSTFEDKLWIKLEYGQKVSELNDVCIKDDNGKRLEFNSAIDGVNKLKNYGYELFSVYTDQINQTSNRPVYVLKRK